jgi:hypothetical protein
MSDLTTKGSDERNAVLAQLRTLTEEQQYDLWGELWEGKHRRTFFKIKPKIVEVEAPAPPPPAAVPTGLRNSAVVTAADLQSDLALVEERPLPLPPPMGGYLHASSPSQEGIEYVAFSPPASPVLRCLKQALYDKLIVPESGYIGKVCLFDDPKFFPDHTPKTEKDTNMTCQGCLGFPLEYDLSWIDLKFEKFSHPDDIRRVLKGLTFRWIRGQNTPWLRLTLSGFEPLLMTEGVLSENLKDHVKGQLADFKETGIWTRYRVSVLTPDGLSQRITSSELFRVEVSCPDGGMGELHGPVHLKVLLGDQLYTQI